MLFDPATRMRWRVEQPESAIIGSIILSPVASREDITSPVFVVLARLARTWTLRRWIVFEAERISAWSIAPSAGPRTAGHARLPDSHRPISCGRDLISRALQPRFYMSRIRLAVSITFAGNHTGFGVILAVGRHYSVFRKGQDGSPRIPMLFRSCCGGVFDDRGALPATHPCADGAVGLFASSRAGNFCEFANGAVRASWRPKCRSIVDILLDCTTGPLVWFNWIVWTTSPPSNPPRGSSTITMWSYGSWIGLWPGSAHDPNRCAKNKYGVTGCHIRGQRGACLRRGVGEAFGQWSLKILLASPLPDDLGE